MRAWQFTEVGAPLSCNEIDEPEPAADEIVLEVRAAGLCHSDVGFLDGTLTSLLPFAPITLGHEIAGVVAAVGSEADRFSVGEPVVVPAAVGGPGIASPGGLQRRIAVREELVIPLPGGIAWDAAAAATDAGATSYHAVVEQAGVVEGSKVGIIGLGGLGSIGAQVALARGAEVCVAEKNESVHDFAREIGASGVSTSITAFADRNLDVVIDFAGCGTTTSEAVEVVPRNGRVVLVGLGVPRGALNLQALTLKQVHLIGCEAGSARDCEAILALIAEGAVRPLTTMIGFDEIGAGVGRLERGEVAGRLVALFE